MKTQLSLIIALIAVAVFVSSRQVLAATNRTLSTLPTTRWGFSDVALQGNYAYLAEAGVGVTVVDITDYAHPTALRSVTTPDILSDIVFDGTTLYTQDNSVASIIDVTDPVNPILRRSITPANGMGLPNDVAASGNDLYLVASSNTAMELQKYDVTTKTSPTFVSSLSLFSGQSHPVGHITLSNGYAYITCKSILYVVNLATMTLAATYTDPAATFKDSVVVDSTLYVNGNGLHAISIANPATPTAVFSALDNVTGGVALTAANGYLYVTKTDGQVVIYDIHSTNFPVLVDALAGTNYGSGIVVRGSVAYVANGLIFQLLDVSQPIVTGTVDTAKVGAYELTYTVMDLSAHTTATPRSVYVAPTLSTVTVKNNKLTITVNKIKVTMNPFPGYRGAVVAKKVVLNTAADPYYLFVNTASTKPVIVVYSSNGKLVKRLSLGTMTTTGLRVQLEGNPLTSSVFIAVSPSRNSFRVKNFVLNKSGLKQVNTVAMSGSKNGVLVTKFMKTYDDEFALVTAEKSKTNTIHVWRYAASTKRFTEDTTYSTALITLSGGTLALKRLEMN